MKPQKRKVTIRDVALEAGVGLQTVSRVINGGPYVKASTAARINAAIKKLAFQPNEAARTLKGQRARTIGLIIPDLVDPFFSACAHAVQQVATAENYMTFVLTSERRAGFEAKEVAMMAARNISGLLIIPSENKTGAKLSELKSAGIPVVTMDRIIEADNTGEVTVDNEGGARDAVVHLLGHGHRRILAIGYDSRTSTVADRIKGYRAAMKKGGAKAEVLTCESRETVQAQLLKRLTHKMPPTALFCLSNIVTASSLAALDSKGIDVPDGIALIGFDDLEFASLLKIPVTAVRQPAEDIGRSAAKLLLRQIQESDPVPKAKTRIVLPTELIIRRSCGCPFPV